MPDDPLLWAVRAHVGPGVDVYRYPRDIDSPINVVLDSGEAQCANPFVVYWAVGGLPECFSLPTFSPAPVVFNQRWVEVAAHFRNLLLATTFDSALFAEVARRYCLSLMSEFSLQLGQPVLGLSLLAESIKGQSIYWTTPIEELEFSPKDESYMAVWFFGLAHEIGHVQSRHALSNLFPEERLVEQISLTLARYPYPKWLKDEAIEAARSEKQGHPLSVAHLKYELTADLFGWIVLLDATVKVMSRDEKGVNIFAFAFEVINMMNLVTLTDRCKAILGARDQGRIREEALYTPVVAHVRATLMLQEIARYCSVVLDTSKSIETWFDDLVVPVNRLQGKIDLLEVATAQAMEQAVAGPSDREWIRSTIQAALAEPLTLVGLQLERFYGHARSLGVTDPEIEWLGALLQSQD